MIPVRIGAADQKSANANPARKAAIRPHAVPKPVRCGNCKRLSVAWFDEGFNVKAADKLMNGRPIKGDCRQCGKMNVEVIPIPNLTPSDAKEFAHLVHIQETLGWAADNDVSVDRKSVVMPLAKTKQVMARDAAMAADRAKQLEEGRIISG